MSHDDDALWADDPIGRFVVVRRLGAGGMGTVYEARDPELSRSVAIKVLRDRGGDTMRLLREAQALARLSHPNVIGVHELGSHDGRVFVAMELVDGVTLDRHLADHARTWRDVLAAFVPAGRGLAAVHAEGLVHRDVKPSNILVDARGRVRLGDFGLARHDAGPSGTSADAITADRRPATAGDRTAAPGDTETSGATSAATDSTVDAQDESAAPAAATPDVLASPLTAAGAVVGTPRYMAPEQAAGRTVGVAADQFSFCVALWESLHRGAPFHDGVALAASLADGDQPGGDARIPGWLERAVARGLAVDPAARWPSMDALCDELEQRPRRRRRLALTAALALALAATGATAVLLARRGAEVSCGEAGADAAQAWSPARRSDLARAFAATGLSWAPDAAARTSRALDAWIDRWRAARVDACRATHERGEESAAMLDKRSVCLDRQLVTFSALVAAMAHADAKAIENAQEAAGQLPSPELCSAARLADLPAQAHDARTVAVDRSLAAARAALDLRSPDLATLADRAQTAADQLGAPGPRARALRIRANAESGTDADAARRDIEAAQTVAATAHDPVLEADIAMDAVDLSAAGGAADRTSALLPVAHAAVERAGNLPAQVRRLAVTEFHADAVLGRFKEARAACDRAIAASSPVEGKDQAAQCGCLLAMYTRHDADALAPCRDWVAQRRATYGDVHPKTATAQFDLVQALLRNKHLDEALTEARALEAAYEQLFGPRGRDVALMLRLIGTIEDEQGHAAQGLRDLEAALALFDQIAAPDDPKRDGFLIEVALREASAGKLADADTHADASLALARRHYGVDAPELITAYVLHGQVLRMDPAQRDRALDSFAKALAICEKYPDKKPFLADTLAHYGEALLQFQRYRDALPILRRAQPVYAALGDAMDGGDIAADIGQAELALHDRAAARAAYQHAHDLYVQAGPRAKAELADVDKHLAGLR